VATDFPLAKKNAAIKAAYKGEIHWTPGWQVSGFAQRKKRDNRIMRVLPTSVCTRLPKRPSYCKHWANGYTINSNESVKPTMIRMIPQHMMNAAADCLEGQGMRSRVKDI
jgi:hypothetical protein